MLADGMPPFPDGVPRLDTNRVIRYGPKRKAWYRLFEFLARNGKRYITGAYGIWGQLDSTKIQSNFEGMHPDERERLQRSMAELERREREKRDRQAAHAANRARQQWGSALQALPAGVACEYLAGKGVSPERGLRFFADGTLLVPMIRYDVTEADELDPEYMGPKRMVGVQKILPDGTKRFNSGMAKQGAMCRFGEAEDGQVILVAEGLATALTLRAAMLHAVPVFVAFDAYNLLPAARILRALYPSSSVVFCADDDWKTDGNPGVSRAEAAAREIGNALAWPPVFSGERGDKDTDFNDLAAREGLGAVEGQMVAAIVAAAATVRPAFESQASDGKVVQFPESKGKRGKRGAKPSRGGDVPDEEGEPVGGGDDDGAPPGGDGKGPPVDPDDPRPNITVTAGRLPDAVDDAERALMAWGEQMYQRDRMLVRVVRRSVPSVRNYKRPAGTLGIMQVELPFLVETLTRVARWWRWDPRGKGQWVRTNAPDKVAGTYMARAGHWHLPELWSVVTAPTLRPDGTIMQKPGYDAEMKAWYDPCGIEFPVVPETPSMDDAIRSLDKLKKAFSSFPFAEAVDMSVALSLAMCALVRRSLTSAPLGAITAPVMGSGKTLLADVISILATGSASPKMTYTEQEEEFKKTLLAVLMEGDQVVLIDNVQAPLQGDTLCSVLTSETYSQRMLGRTEMVKVQTTALLLANGNQLVIAGDLRTRALLCRIDPKTEHPEEREFQTELREWFLYHRPQLVAAALTVMRAYVVSGKKNGGDHAIKPFGRFEHWSEMVRAPLVWLGQPDPCASIKELERDDPERSALRQVLFAWRGAYGVEPKKSSEVCTAMSDAALLGSNSERVLEEALREIARDRDGQWSARRLSRWLAKHANRRAEGLMLARAEDRDHTQVWKVVEVDNTQS